MAQIVKILVCAKKFFHKFRDFIEIFSKNYSELEIFSNNFRKRTKFTECFSNFVQIFNLFLGEFVEIWPKLCSFPQNSVIFPKLIQKSDNLVNSLRNQAKFFFEL